MTQNLLHPLEGEKSCLSIFQNDEFHRDGEVARWLSNVTCRQGGTLVSRGRYSEAKSVSMFISDQILYSCLDMSIHLGESSVV